MTTSLRWGPMLMALLVTLATVGVAYAAWTDSLAIEGQIETGRVSADVGGGFTDDDGTVDDAAFDGGDTGECGADAPSSCDPAAGGPDPKARQSYDAARCDAALVEPGVAQVATAGAYPGYFCTAWFDVSNDGSVPVAVAEALVNGEGQEPGAVVGHDLDGDGVGDIALTLSGFELCDQIDPGTTSRVAVVQETLEPGQDTSLTFSVELVFRQWNAVCGEATEDAATE